MIKKFIKYMYGKRRYEQLLKVPRQYANHIDPADVDFDSVIVMARSNARSPDNVRALMREYNVNSVDELLKHLPDQRYFRRPRSRLISMLRNFFGYSPYNPDLQRKRRLRRIGFFDRPDIHERIARVKDFE